MKKFALRALVLTAAVMISGSVFAKSLPLETFFKKPQYAGFQLSPDGNNVGVLAPINDRLNIVVIDLNNRELTPVTGIKDQDVSGFIWANNERLLFFMDKDGSESFGIFAVNKDGSMARTLVQPLASQLSKGQRVIRFTQLLDVLEKDQDHVLVVNNDRRASYPDVYKMNIVTGRKQLVQRNPGNVTGWITDWDGNIIGANYTDGVEGGFQMLNKETGEWEEYTRGRYDEPGYSLAGITGDLEHAYVNSQINPDGSTRDKAAVFKYNLKTREIGDMVYEHDQIDCCNVMMTKAKKDMIGISYMVGKPEVVYTDEKWKAIMDGINQALPNTINGVSSMSDDERVMTVVASSSTQPPRYFLYHTERKALEPMGDSRPWINAGDMAEMKPVTFQARDGMTLHGYLTLPKGSDGKNLPLIMNPHGGPWARDGWGFNPETQFLANRGYAVLQVNFRGSVGFGMQHLLSSKKQWGRAMQDDVSDAVNWAIGEGIADKGKVCIYGGSYGGYATMAGLTFSPELYQCGINYVGVTDLPLLFKTAPDAWASGMDYMKEMVGDPDTEKEFLEQWSPSNHADKIKVPVFMAYGAQDPRVDISHAKVMEKALKKNGVKYELMVKRDEGHGYRKQENQYDYYRKVESFLAENL